MPTPQAREVPPKSTEVIASEWDRLAATRLRQLGSGEDFSYDHILVPSVLELIESTPGVAALDVGCGLGSLTAKLAARFQSVTGVDPSVTSISAARAAHPLSNVEFIATSIEEFSKKAGRQFDCVVANMVLMNVANLASVVSAVRRLMGQGEFVFSLTHPWFWPTYWSYASEPWFRYEREIFVEAPFRISREATKLKTTHIHRPLSQYVETLWNAGFTVELLREPGVPESAPDWYRKAWRYPRFVVGRAISR